MILKVLVTVAHILVTVHASELLFQKFLPNYCLLPSYNRLATMSLVNDRQCAIKCSFADACDTIQVTPASETCGLYSLGNYSNLISQTYQLPGACSIITSLINVIHQGAKYTTNGTFQVPAGVYSVIVLAIGGGAGGNIGGYGGAGSGYVTYGSFSVSPGQTFTVTVGSGGTGGYVSGNIATNGSSSRFGNLLTANGGKASTGGTGGAGGSGGGAGSFNRAYEESGSGGSGGSDGTQGGTWYSGGVGQGSYTSWFTNFKFSVLSAGAGAVGVYGNSNAFGGGGAGGLLIDGVGPLSGAGGCCNICPSIGATGYGAGGSSGCYGSAQMNGGNGANGLVYIEY